MRYLSFILCFLLLCSCKENNKHRIARLVQEWQGKEIKFPENITFTRYVRDTVDYQIPETNYKVLIYVDSIGCISCKLQLYEWKQLIAHTDSITGGTVPFLFFFYTKDYNEIRHVLRVDQFDLPVCIDKGDRLNKLNKFPSDMAFQTFLLNKDNKVIVIGNPVHNAAVKELYMQQITGQDSLNVTL